MAWRNILIDIAFPEVAQITVTDFSLLELTTFPGDLSSYISQPIAGKNDFNVGNAWTVVMGESPDYIDAIKQSGNSCTVRLYMNGFRNQYSYGNDFIATGYTWGYIACVDDENQKGFFAMVMKTNVSTAVPHFWAGSTPPLPNSKESQTNLYYRDGMYTLLTGNEIHQYEWSSVPAISGKNGILSLTTLKEESINDGSPVDDATESAFNNAPNSCSVGGIVSVDLPIVDDNPLSIAVKYNIPELTDSVYSSCKVVAKKNKIPKSKTDGDKILDVSPSSHGCVIKGLEQETKYYVVVFVEDSFGNKAESEPGGPVRTGKKPVGIFFMRTSVSKVPKDSNFIETITASKV